MNRRRQSFMSFLLPVLLIILIFSYIGDIFNTSNNIGKISVQIK